MSNSEEIWQVDVNGQIYETTFAELPGWIAESSLVETDKVRRGNLRWLEAGKVPALVPFFNAKADGEEIPGVSVTTTAPESELSMVPDGSFSSDTAETTGGTAAINQPQSYVTGGFSGSSVNKVPDGSQPQLPDPEHCCIHPDLPSSYICSACLHPFCRDCPEGFGATVRICPYCGAMCKDLASERQRLQFEARFDRDISAGFGFDDFGKALAFPFKFKSSLLFGGFLFALLSLGQGAASIGSIFLVAAALICFMMANALTFGVLANTVDNFSQGHIDRNFMPSFDDFSLWDDVVHPFFLSIAVYISSFGLLIVLVLGAVWYAWSSFAGSFAPAADPAQAMLADDEGETPRHIQELLKQAQERNSAGNDSAVGEDGLTEFERRTLDEEAEFMKLNELASDYRKQQLESVVGQTPESADENFRAGVMQFIRVAGAFILLAGLALLWGLFYFPAACAVAGYTRSFTATINPLVGLDTIRHLGLDYVKILLMLLLISIMSGVIGAVLGLVFMPFDLPAFGNLPAKFFGSFATFYFSVVLAVILGFALYKNSEKLRLYRG